MLIEKRIRIVPVDLRLSFPTVHFRAESQLDVGIVETALIAACEIVCFDQMHIQIRLIEVISQAQMKPAQMLSCPAITQLCKLFLVSIYRVLLCVAKETSLRLSGKFSHKS